jgi:hypothetical protein
MPLDPASVQIVSDWLQKHVRQPMTCALCGGTKWTVGDLVVMFSVLNHAPGGAINIQIGAPPGPPLGAAIPITCENCKNTLLFPSKPLGL